MLPERSTPAVQPPSRCTRGSVLLLVYGSNLDIEQMAMRCPTAVPAGRARLAHHALAFGGFSHRWRGGVASLVRAPGAQAEGIVFRVAKSEVKRLDGYEGVPFAYERVTRKVVDQYGERRRVHLYVQHEDTFQPGLPARRYFAVLWRAYERWGLDQQALITATMEATR
jgi:gamma-glutamylcyclotransferase